MSQYNRCTTRTCAQSAAVAALSVAITAFASLAQAQYYPYGSSYQNSCSYPTLCLPQTPYHANPNPTISAYNSSTNSGYSPRSTSDDQVERTVGGCYDAGLVGVCVDNQGTFSVDAGQLVRGEVYIGRSNGACLGVGVKGKLGPVGVDVSGMNCYDSQSGWTDQRSFQAGSIQYTETRPVYPR
jgi:hypothetical protein